MNPLRSRGLANIKEIDGGRFVSTIQNPVTGRRALKLGTAVSEKLLKRLGGFLRPLLKHPVSGVLQHDDGHVCRNELSLLPFSASPNDFSPPMVSTGMGSLVGESCAASLAACWHETK